MRSKGLSTVLKLIVVALVILATVDLIHLRSQIAERKEEAAALDAAITETQQDIEKLQSDMGALSTDEGIKSVARNQLGLVGEGEIVFRDIGN